MAIAPRPDLAAVQKLMKKQEELEAKEQKEKIQKQKELNARKVTKVDRVADIPPHPPVDLSSPEVKKFIESAPDGQLRKRKLKGRKVIITHSIEPDDLDKLDDLAKTMGLKRAGLINLLIKKAILRQSI